MVDVPDPPCAIGFVNRVPDIDDTDEPKVRLNEQSESSIIAK